MSALMFKSPGLRMWKHRLQQTMYDNGRFIQMVLRVLQDRRDTMAGLAVVLQPCLDLTSQAPALYLHLACFRESPAACARPEKKHATACRIRGGSVGAVAIRSEIVSTKTAIQMSTPFRMKQTLPCVGFRTEHSQSTVGVQSEYIQSTFGACDLQQFCAVAIQENKCVQYLLSLNCHRAELL